MESARNLEGCALLRWKFDSVEFIATRPEGDAVVRHISQLFPFDTGDVRHASVLVRIYRVPGTGRRVLHEPTTRQFQFGNFVLAGKACADGVAIFDADSGCVAEGFSSPEVSVRYWGPLQEALVCLRACVCELIRYLGFVQLHVAAVSSRNNIVMLFGPSGCGKTSTSVALHNAGWTLHAEDNAWVRPETLEAVCGDRTLRFHAESMAFLGVNPQRSQFDPVRGKYAFDVGQLQRFEPRFQPNRFVYILPQRSRGSSRLRAMSRRDFVLTFLSGQGIPLLVAGRRNLNTFLISAQRYGSFHSLALGDPPVTLAEDSF